MTIKNKQYRVLYMYEDETVYPIHIAARSKEEAKELIEAKFSYTEIKVLRVEEVK